MATPFPTDPMSGIRSFVAPRRQALLGLASGLLQGNDWGQGLGMGFQRAAEGARYDDAYATAEKEKADRQSQINQTVKYLRQKPGGAQWADAVEQGLIDSKTAFQGWTDASKPTAPNYTANQRDYMFAQENPGFSEFLGQGSGGTEFGLQPIWFQRADGSYGYGVQGKDGTFKEVDTGGNTMLDPRSLNFERGYGGAAGKAAGEATAAAPGDIAAGQTALGLIDQIRTSPELGWATGTSAGLGGNAIPGTGRFGFQNLVDQAKSGAFLTAVQEMRGLGALSNAEGQAATQAITRINTALSKEDFLKALADYEAIVKRGMERAQARLQGGSVPQSGGQGGAQQPAAGGYTILGVE